MKKKSTSNKKTAIITGISGQDAAYLAKILITQDYRVVGVTRKKNPILDFNLNYLGIADDVHLEECDLSSFQCISTLIKKIKPDEYYNLSAQSSVGASFVKPGETLGYNIISVVNGLEAIRLYNPSTRFYQASSSEIYGDAAHLPLTEDSPINPISPYGMSKAMAQNIVSYYKDTYNLFCCSGILFNHESYLRTDNYFIKKVITSAVKIANNELDFLTLGEIDIKRDFGFSQEYMKAIHLMMQQNIADNYIICSGVSISLRDIVEYVFLQCGVGIDKVITNKSLTRPREIIDNYGSNKKAQSGLGWKYDLSFYKVLDIIINEEINGRN